MSPAEGKALVSLFSEPALASRAGVTVAGNGYNVVKADRRSIPLSVKGMLPAGWDALPYGHELLLPFDAPCRGVAPRAVVGCQALR